MVLADTTVWVDHFRRGNPALARLLELGHIVTHPFIVGELALGGIPNRGEVLTRLRALRGSRLAEQDEVLALIERKKLWGKGMGWVDVHLLASALIERCRLWTFDHALERAARELGLAMESHS